MLSHIALLEQRAADLYAHYASLFRHDAEAHTLFLRMKREEDGHYALVKLQERVVNGSDAGIVPVAVDMSGIDSIVQAIEAQLSVRNTELLNALDFAIMLETNGMEASYRTLLTRQNPDLAKLSNALSSGDQHHVNNLKRVKESVVSRRAVPVR